MVHLLRTGTVVTLRPIRPGDKAALADGLTKLSRESVYRRFLQPKPRLSSAELRYLTEVDGHDHVALVAELAGTGAGPRPVVAVGRWVRDREHPDRAEVAVVVCDALQGQGLGTALGRALADLARERGVRRLTATMLADNQPALRLLAAITGRLESRVASGVRELTGDLAPVPSSLPSPSPSPPLPLAA